ncbi:MAG: GspH/FimT family pseudopilin [Methylococcaceae bacterium]|nr:GspH/FimT family pseudopilin [Methylococcaceae bacterium]
MHKKYGQGFTLTELMITVAIVGIVASLAVPSFQDMLERNRLKEAVESLKSDLMFARTEAIKRSANLTVSIKINGSSWCYGINDSNCDCSTAGSCAIKNVDGSQFQETTVPAGTSTNIPFDFRRGTAFAGGVTISTSNYSVRSKVSNSGRITVCSPDSTKAMGGYDAC